MTYSLEPIAVVSSPFKEKFGVPRQPGIIPVISQIDFLHPYSDPDAFTELDTFSHIWVTFVFHQAMRQSFTPRVRPPRLGGNEKVGVFASRSPFRPNSLGLSVVKLVGIERSNGKVVLHVEGLDVIDGTPVVDIKPYIPYVDRVEDAEAGYALEPPKQVFQVEFTHEAVLQLKQYQASHLGQLLVKVLGFDLRPAYKQGQKTGQFGILLDNFNVRYEIRDNQIWVLSINPA